MLWQSRLCPGQGNSARPPGRRRRRPDQSDRADNDEIISLAGKFAIHGEIVPEKAAFPGKGKAASLQVHAAFCYSAYLIVTRRASVAGGKNVLVKLVHHNHAAQPIQRQAAGSGNVAGIAGASHTPKGAACGIVMNGFGVGSRVAPVARRGAGDDHTALPVGNKSGGKEGSRN